MEFNISSMKGATEVGSRIEAGIHNAKFISVNKDVLDTQNGKSAVMSLKVDIEGYGEYTQNFFVPTEKEDAKRTDGLYGPNPSRVEHFMLAVRQIIGATNPEVLDKIDKGEPIIINDEEVTLDGSFDQLIAGLKKIVSVGVGKATQVKLIPGKNGFVAMPTFCAKIDSRGNVRIQTRFIGDDLTLSSSEVKRIEAAKTAKPTNMTAITKTSDLLNSMKEEFSSKDELDDLPF